MKPIIEKENQDTILTSEITNEHIVVGIINDAPRILVRENYCRGNFYFRNLISEFTAGNGIGNFDSAKQAVENKIDCKLEVFKESDWKKALQWLIDNAE